MPTINHQFLHPSTFFPTWKINVLILGTFNPECGEATDYFYGRKLNSFWRAIESILNKNEYELQNNYKEKLKIMTTCKFGCTDIIKSVKILKGDKDTICGKGYSDQILFTKSKIQLNYQFDEIKEYIKKNKVQKVINTWGKRTNPISFQNNINDLRSFCKANKVVFVDDCPSPSGRLRGREHFEVLKRFYKKHLIPNC